MDNIFHVDRGEVSLQVELTFTIDKWGGFNVGDGEYFKEYKDLFTGTPDFFIRTVRKDDDFFTTFIPNPFNKVDMSDWKDKDHIDLFKYATTRKFSIPVFQEWLKTNKIGGGIYKEAEGLKGMVINDFVYYYAGALPDELVMKCLPEMHPEFNELLTLRELCHKS